MLYILPLEPLEERYTIQWYRWFIAELLTRYGLHWKYIEGRKLTESVEVGLVLDAVGTNYWKFTQMQAVCEAFRTGAVHDGDVFFTFDLWHPGLEAIPYMAQLMGIKVKVCGFLHAGSYSTLDFAQPMANWAKHFEAGWYAMCDKIFVGSYYHAHKFFSNRVGGFLDAASSRIYALGNPFSSQEILASLDAQLVPVAQRDNIIVFPHRWDRGKRPELLIQIAADLWKRRKDFKVLITTGRKELTGDDTTSAALLAQQSFSYEVKTGVSKNDFYNLLASAKIVLSTTIEENFGYSVMEAVALGCCPVVPNNCSHPEILQYVDGFMYSDPGRAVDLLNAYLDHPISFVESAVRYDTVVSQIVDELIDCLPA